MAFKILKYLLIIILPLHILLAIFQDIIGENNVMGILLFVDPILILLILIFAAIVNINEYRRKAKYGHEEKKFEQQIKNIAKVYYVGKENQDKNLHKSKKTYSIYKIISITVIIYLFISIVYSAYYKQASLENRQKLDKFSNNPGVKIIININYVLKKFIAN